MRLQKKFFGWLLLTVLFSLALQPKAYAYLDPGTGSFFTQMLLAGLVGLSFFIKTFWQAIKNFFSRIFKGSKLSKDKP